MDLLHVSDGDPTEEGYENFLTAVQQKGMFCSLKFACRHYVPEKCKDAVKRKPQDVWKSVLDSDRVQWIVNNLAREEEKDKSVIIRKATAILKEMAYLDHLSLVRMFGFTLYHALHSIYHEGVFYNTGTLEAIRKTMREHPVVFMPSHRCYADFLVISVLCVYLDLPLPAIASGMDFMKMTGINYILRSSGAFFMRRSFGSDRLYWALFTEYIHTIIINVDRPIEFFIEGTRSRSGKSLTPKLGLFSVIAEPYLKAQIYDVMIVPTSISYDRILEESLYAYELLGVPKPKESTSGLFKATSILSQNFGSLHVHFAEPLSLREECGPMDRAVHACYPRYMLRLTKKEQNYLNNLAYKIVQIQQQNMVISVWSVIATVLCQYEDGIEYKDLVEQVQWLHEILRKWRVKIRTPSGNMGDVIQRTLHKFTHLVKVVTEDARSTKVIIIQQNKKSAQSSEKLASLTPDIRDNAAIHIMLASYRNQLVHVFVNSSLVAIGLQHVNNLLSHKIEEVDLSCEDAHSDFNFLRRIFEKEFIFPPDDTDLDYAEGIRYLHSAGAVYRQNGLLHYSTRGAKLIAFLMDLMHPFLLAYTLICHYLGSHHHECEFKDLCNLIQLWMAKKGQEENLTPELLSKDMIGNGVRGVANVGAVSLHKIGGDTIVRIKRTLVLSTHKRLSSLMKEKTLLPKTSSSLAAKL